MRLFGIVFAVVIACFAAQAAETTRCVYPDPHALLGPEAGNLERVEYRLFETKAGPMRWLFLSWENPAGGMAFVLACDGHVVAKRAVGDVVMHTWGQPGIIGPGTGVDITTSSTTGAGVLVESESWLQFDGKAINVLWTHDSLVITHDARDQTTDNYGWTFFPPQNEIRVTGKRTKAPGDEANSVALPEEKYCFRAAANRYVRC